MWIGEERQPGSDWPAELELVFDWSRGPDVTIIRLIRDFHFILFYAIIFPKICDLSRKKACLKPKTVIIHTQDVHKVERVHEITGEWGWGVGVGE